MADQDAPSTRPPEPVSICVVRVRNLKGTKGDNVNTLVKLEFGEKTLGESPKVDCSPDNPAEFNYTANLNCTYDDPYCLDEIAHKPIVLTIIEVLPKEKKQKEEKTTTLGQCTIDLLPLVKGEVKCSYTLTINPLPGSPLEQIQPENPKPEVDVCISVNEPLLDEVQLQDGNLMTVTLESLFSPPDSWSLSGTQHTYAAALPVPVTAEKEVPVVFAAGQLKPGIDKELPNKQKKWAVPGAAQANSTFIPDSFISSDAIEDEDGEFRAKEDREYRGVVESEKNRLTWNTERRCYLDSPSVRNFQERIAKTRYWPVEVMRLPLPSGGKGKKDDDGSIGFHGVAFVNLAPLLYPGVKRIRGAYKVYSYTDQVLYERTKRRGGLADEAARIAANILSRNSNSPFQKKAGKDKEGDKKEKDVKKGRSNSVLPASTPDEVSQTIKSDAGSELDGPGQVNVEGQQYIEAKSYMMIEICLARPLVRKRSPEEMAKKVASYIPPRPLFPKRTDGAQRSVEDFHSQVASVANLILDEFRDLFGDDDHSADESAEARRQKLIYELNSSGKYFAFKEQLKHSVVKIVREKYLKTSNFDDKQELQMFLSELYVYLIDQMHIALGKTLAVEDQAPVPEPLTDSAQLKHFAREAEANGNFDLATKYYQERIARNRNNPDHWFDYGTFCLYINNVTKAEECFKECIAINQKHLQGLLLYGVVCTLSERHEAAETFFEAATNVDPKSILAWTMLGLFYDAINNEIGAEMAYLEANKLNQAAAVATMRSQRSKGVDEKKMVEAEEDVDITPRAGEGGLSGIVPEIKTPLSTSEKPPTSARSSSRVTDRKMSAASNTSGKKHPGSGQGLKKSESSAASRPGSQQKLGIRGTPQAEESVEEPPPPREPTPVPTSSIYLQAIDWLLEVKAIPFTERALAHELLTPMGGPTSIYHIAFAQLQLQKKEYELAEESLTEAVESDFQSPDGWALMGHVKYLTGDASMAKDCYERTISFVGDASEMHIIYLRLASIYLQEGQFQDAKKTFLLACKRSPSCVSWLGVGIACYRLGELLEAEDALSEANILNNVDPEVWGYLALVCLKTGRQLEAEQSYKYALKVDLKDEDLLAEIHATQKEVGFGNPEF